MEILFPHEKIRETQDVFIQDLNEILKNKKNLIAHAPTGIGKTAAVLSTTLTKTLKDNTTIFFLTPKHTQHKIAFETFKKIKEKYELDFKVVNFIGKKWMCPMSGIEDLYSNEFSEYCKDQREKKLCEYYNNSNKKVFNFRRVLEMLEKEVLSVEEVCKISKENKVCPFEVSCFFAQKAKVIIADYYHVLSPSIRENLFKKTHKELSKSILILDEAHNLPKRIRKLLTFNLTDATIKKAKKEARDFSFSDLIPKLIHLENFLSSLIKKMSIEETEILIEKEEFIFDSSVIEELKIAKELVVEKKKRSYLWTIASFLESWLGPDEGFVRILTKGFTKENKPFAKLSYICLDPSLLFSSLKEAKNIICMSGTLVPTKMYADLFGLNNAKLAEYKNPFPKENKLNLIVPETTTKFTERNEKMFMSIAKLCSDFVNTIPGNNIIFFPSYKIRDTVNNYFTSLCKKTTFLEERNLSKKEREELLEKFKSYRDSGAVLLAVSAASFGEGIDLPGDFLKAVVIVGLPLTKPDLETKELIKYYDEKFDKGLDYGYIIPAIIGAMQNAGRCIRSETDKGVIIFLDKRYIWQNYLKCFPTDWQMKISHNPINEITQFFS